MEPFLGSWKLETSENFDDVMKELGVSLITRKIAQNISPILIVSSLGDGQYKMRSESAFKNTEFEFMLGEEFEEETPDGRIVRSTITIDGNTLKQVQVGNKTTYIDRVVEGNKLKAIEPFLGSWKLETSKNFDELMRELGVGLVTRRILASINPTLIVSSLGGGKYKMRSESAFKTTEFEFKLGEEFEEETLDGRIVRSTITIDGNTLKQVQVANNTTYIDRVVEGNKLKTIFTVNGVVSTRIHVKI
ncbi:unnamed protein product [Mesocestoides corti]|uniref:Cytosolic fatty-acid binding proteins domain-containing protein n=2 Tax=Mesocestoides corti TaxID=53468 RepID=A0A0R3UAT5_MESCO|nr:unnamed protein product [Mesocestoides corti]